jgi:prepilin-type N-terminal cleavage/methylation domain-containing protein
MWSENGVRAQIVSNARGASVNRESVERRETNMKNLLHKDGGFTLIELLVVILIISILIAVSAPSFLGQTKKANDSAAKQQNAVAYKAAAAYAVDGTDANGAVIDANHAQGSFSGFATGVLTGFEPELTTTTVSGVTADGLTITTVGSVRTCVLTVVGGLLQPQTCSNS